MSRNSCRPGSKMLPTRKASNSSPLRSKSVFGHFDRVEQFEIPVLIGDGAVRAQSADLDLRSRRGGGFHDTLQDLSIMTSREPRDTPKL